MTYTVSGWTLNSTYSLKQLFLHQEFLHFIIVRSGVHIISSGCGGVKMMLKQSSITCGTWINVSTILPGHSPAYMTETQ